MRVQVGRGDGYRVAEGGIGVAVTMSGCAVAEAATVAVETIALEVGLAEVLVTAAMVAGSRLGWRVGGVVGDAVLKPPSASAKERPPTTSTTETKA